MFWRDSKCEGENRWISVRLNEMLHMTELQAIHCNADVAKDWKQPPPPSMGHWLSKLWSVLTMADCMHMTARVRKVFIYLCGMISRYGKGKHKVHNGVYNMPPVE